MKTTDIEKLGDSSPFLIDPKSADPFRADPGSPRFIFFDDPKPSKEQRLDHNNALQYEEWLAAQSDWTKEEAPKTYLLVQPDGSEKEITHAEAMEIKAKNRWTLDWHKRFNRNKLTFSNILGQVIHKSSIKQPNWLEAGERPDPIEARELRHLQLRTSMISILEDFLKLDAFFPRPPSKTVFLNPDGSRFETNGKSPVSAKSAFLERHKPKNFRFEYQGVIVVGKDYTNACALLRNQLREETESFVREALEERFPRNPITEEDVMTEQVIKEDGSSYWFVAKRTPSDRKPSSYYDPEPTLIDTLTTKGWEKKYTWAGSNLIRVPKDKTFEGHRLTVRELERALMQGAEFEENLIESMASYYENIPAENEDTDEDGTALKGRTTLCYDEEFLSFNLLNYGFEHAHTNVLRKDAHEINLHSLLTSSGLEDEDLFFLLVLAREEDKRNQKEKDWEPLFPKLVNLFELQELFQHPTRDTTPEKAEHIRETHKMFANAQNDYNSLHSKTSKWRKTMTIVRYIAKQKQRLLQAAAAPQGPAAPGSETDL